MSASETECNTDTDTSDFDEVNDRDEDGDGFDVTPQSSRGRSRNQARQDSFQMSGASLSTDASNNSLEGLFVRGIRLKIRGVVGSWSSQMHEELLALCLSMNRVTQAPAGPSAGGSLPRGQLSTSQKTPATLLHNAA